jgi:hypothetical protein
MTAGKVKRIEVRSGWMGPRLAAGIIELQKRETVNSVRGVNL